MAFYGCQFIFAGIPSWRYGLVIYDLGGINEDGVFSSSPKIVEDRTGSRYTPLHYGVTRNEPLKFKLHFGASPDAIDQRQWLDRWELEAIATWLTEQDEYQYLEVIQSDLEIIRYRCFITDLQYSTYGKYPWTLTAEVTCDGPYAYLAPETTEFQVTSEPSAVTFRNRASPKYYKPKLEITIDSGTALSITNHSDGDRVFSFGNITSTPDTIYVDNENEIITDSIGLNLYEKFGLKFFRLVRGKNELEFTVTPNDRGQASATICMICEFPINAGG